MIQVVKIVGRSMEPVLNGGDYGVFFRFSKLKPNSIVLVDHPRYGRIVKSVRSVEGDELELEGTCAHSLSTQQLGKIPRRWVRAGLIKRIPC